MARAKRRFSYEERYAVWHCNEERCWLCINPLRLHDVTIDHVLPESLLDDDEKRKETFDLYGLPVDFNINGYENWLPCHNRCNQTKSNKAPAFVPGNKMILDGLRQSAWRTARTARSVLEDATKDNVLKTIFAALENQKISMRDLGDLLRGFIDNPTGAGVPDDVIILDSGYWVRRGQIVREDTCCCERESCVDQDGKVYCYFESSLPQWVVKTGLYWKCYDEIVNCPRCSNRHKRGHIGRQGVCGRPYRDQEMQCD